MSYTKQTIINHITGCTGKSMHKIIFIYLQIELKNKNVSQSRLHNVCCQHQRTLRQCGSLDQTNLDF